MHAWHFYYNTLSTFYLIKKHYCPIKNGHYFLCPFVLIQKNEKIKSLIILQCTPLLKNDQCSDLCELLYGAHISAPRRIDLFFQNNRRRKKILSIGLNYFTQIIIPPPEGDEGGGKLSTARSKLECYYLQK